jgi:hypothetical protein
MAESWISSSIDGVVGYRAWLQIFLAILFKYICGNVVTEIKPPELDEACFMRCEHNLTIASAYFRARGNKIAVKARIVYFKEGGIRKGMELLSPFQRYFRCIVWRLIIGMQRTESITTDQDHDQ